MKPRNWVSLSLLSSTPIGWLGGLIGLGGAEFRLPVLMGLLKFGPLDAVILNKAMSLIVVAVALPARAAVVPLSQVASQWSVIVTLLCGSLVGAWFGAGFATRLSSRALSRIIAVLLLGVAAVLLLGHGLSSGQAAFSGVALTVVGVAAGFGIGVFAALLGVAGGELLIPAIVLLFGADVKLAGSLSLAVSIPTMIVAFSRYGRDASFGVVRREWRLIAVMAVGSIAGSWLGAMMLGVVPSAVLLPVLAAILAISAVNTWRHAAPRREADEAGSMGNVSELARAPLGSEDCG